MTSAPSPNHPAPQDSGTFRKLIIYLPIVILAVFLLVFAIANRQTVALSLSPFPWVIESPLFLLFFFGLFLGALVAWITLAPGRWRAKREARAAQKKALSLEQDARNLRIELDRRQPSHAALPSDQQ